MRLAGGDWAVGCRFVFGLVVDGVVCRIFVRIFRSTNSGIGRGRRIWGKFGPSDSEQWVAGNNKKDRHGTGGKQKIGNAQCVVCDSVVAFGFLDCDHRRGSFWTRIDFGNWSAYVF